MPPVLPWWREGPAPARKADLFAIPALILRIIAFVKNIEILAGHERPVRVSDHLKT